MYKATQTRIQTYLNDVAGVRIVCAFIDDFVLYFIGLCLKKRKVR